MGQFLSSTFWEGSPATVWRERLHDGEGLGAGELMPVLQDHVMHWEVRELVPQHCEVHISLSNQKGAMLSPVRVVWVEPWM